MPNEAIYETSKLHPGEVTGILETETKLCGLVNYYCSTSGGKSVPHYKIDLYSDNNRTIRVYVKDDDLNVIDLTNASALLTVKKTKDTAVVFTKDTDVPAEGAIGAADEGEIFFYILPSDTVSLEDQYVFDVKITLPNSKEYTVVEGIINLLQPVG